MTKFHFDRQVAPDEYVVGGLDRGLSGWGRANRCRSYAFWVCALAEVDLVAAWVGGRSDISRVTVDTFAAWNKRRFKDGDRVSLYEVRPGHAAAAPLNRKLFDAEKFALVGALNELFGVLSAEWSADSWCACADVFARLGVDMPSAPDEEGDDDVEL